ncbi:MAG: DNA repair and recombination protein RadA [Thermoprotei archaeon]
MSVEVGEGKGEEERKEKFTIESHIKKLGIEFMTAKEFLEERRKVGVISTGSKAIDNLLFGGVETRALTEIIGEFGSGKTQLCHQLAVNVQLPREKGGLEGKAVYIDTEGSFRPERIVQMAEAKGLDPDNTLKNILYARAYNSYHQEMLAESLEKKIFKENIRLIIIDSLVSHYRSEYLGREHLVVRQQRLNKHIHMLLRFADDQNVAIVVTNQVVASPTQFETEHPVGGNIIAHGSTYRIFIRKGRDNTRIARIIDSPLHPEAEAPFIITKEGIKDTP